MKILKYLINNKFMVILNSNSKRKKQLYKHRKIQLLNQEQRL